MSDIIKRRDELRKKSEARQKVGLTPYPLPEELDEIVRRLGISMVEAHDKCMDKGIIILESTIEME